MVALAGAFGVVLTACQEKQNQAAAPPAAKTEVNVIVLEPRNVTVTADLPGRTSASLIAEIRPQVSGIIKERLFKEGTPVKAGDALYQIDDAPYQATYESAVAQLARAQGALPAAQAKNDRYKTLVRQNNVSQQDLDAVVAALAQAKADVAAAQANLQAAKINLAYTKIVAPIAGRIDASTVTVGALVTANQAQALTTIRQLDPINVDIIQSSTNLLRFRNDIASGRIKISGENVSVRLKLEDGRMYDKSGTFQFAEANVDQSTGTFIVRAQFPNPEQIVLPGTYVRAAIEEGVAENSFLLPQRAVARNQRGEAVAKFVGKDEKVTERILDARHSVGNSWLINSGIEKGDRLIVEGAQLVRAGQDVVAKVVTLDDATGTITDQTGSVGPAAQPKN